ncbi:hypothetical protein [Kaarinaea lacus]
MDEQFRDVLDSLIMVGLVKTDPKILRRYMGAEGAGKFLGFYKPKYPHAQ